MIIIDNKKIEDAAMTYCAKSADITNRNVDLDIDKCVDLYNGFIAGAKWVQEEFLKDLIHPISEKPKKNSIVLAKIMLYRIILSPEGSKEDICGYIYQVIEFNKRNKCSISELEKEYQCNLKVIEWLYIDDLLPKEGGEDERV